jgi:aromatic-L-amino-acid decarboxylase
MVNRIKQLEILSRALEPNAEERAFLLEKVTQYVNAFLENINHVPAYRATADEGIGLYDSPISEGPIDIDSALNLIKQNVDRPGVNVGSGGYLCFIPGSGLYHSALGDYVAAVTNRYAGVFFASPGAVRMERMLLRWIADFIGYPESAAGDLTSGGSIANLAGIVTARDAFDLKAKDFERSVVYLTKQAHHSVEKALRIAGLKECVKRFIPLDEHYCMKAYALEQAILNDKKSELNPWLIVAAAGTVDTGAVDPLDSIADIAQSHQLWLHVDGAYGGAFALCEMGKKILKEIERADSMIIDPHKGLFLPFGTGAVLVRDGEKLRQAHYYEASYLQDTEKLASSDEISPAELSPELSRHFRGLRLWLPLKLIGVAPFRAALEEKLLLARYFYEKMQSINGFELGPYPDLSIVTYRYIPKRGNVNEFNQQLNHAVQKDGRIFLSSTMIDGKFTLRLAVLGFRTHRDRIDQAIEILQEKARMLSRDD